MSGHEPEFQCKVIAEAGVNHNGDPETAHDMIDAAAEAGADAVKFQTFSTERLVTQEVEVTDYQKRSGYANQYEMLTDLELAESDWGALVEHCNRRDVEFISTPYDRGSVDLLESLGVNRIKIASADIVNKPLLRRVAETDCQIILSTGMASIEEIGQALEWIERKGTDVTLLHCVSEYPTDPADLNLRFIPTLSAMFGHPVGFSDHTIGISAAVSAVALGGRIVEKHFTLDTTMEGPDHEASIEPDKLANLVSAVRVSEQSLGSQMKQVTETEQENANRMRPSLHLANEVTAGAQLVEKDLAVVRPADGLPPRYLEVVVGCTVNSDLSEGQPLTFEDIE